jgi:hypothetical protein
LWGFAHARMETCPRRDGKGFCQESGAAKMVIGVVKIAAVRYFISNAFSYEAFVCPTSRKNMC